MLCSADVRSAEMNFFQAPSSRRHSDRSMYVNASKRWLTSIANWQLDKSVLIKLPLDTIGRTTKPLERQLHARRH